MHAIRVATAALLGVTPLALAAPTAYASAPAGHREHFEAEVSPTSVGPGGEVTLTVSGCKGVTTVTAGIFDTATIRKGTREASITVDEDVKPGATYAVTFSCSTGKTRTVDLTITRERDGAGGEHDRSDDGDGSGQEESGRSDRGHAASYQQDDYGRGYDSSGQGYDSSGQMSYGSGMSRHHGVKAGGGGTSDGLNLQDVGVGAALVVGAVGSAYCMSRRRTDEGEA
jgi:hypothetical protein